MPSFLGMPRCEWNKSEKCIVFLYLILLDKQANIFAATFLMPKEDFIRLSKKLNFNIIKISSFLGLSRSAVRTRMLNVL